MHKSQKVFGVDFVIGLQSAQGGSVLQVILLAQTWDFSRVEAHAITHIDIHALFDSMPQSSGCGIECIVKIEEDCCEFHGVIILVSRFIPAYITGKQIYMLHRL